MKSISTIQDLSDYLKSYDAKMSVFCNGKSGWLVMFILPDNTRITADGKTFALAVTRAVTKLEISDELDKIAYSKIVGEKR